MSGRADHGEKIKEKLYWLTATKPEIVSEYCNALFASKEPTTCQAYVSAVCDLIDYCADIPTYYDVRKLNESNVAEYMYDFRYRKQPDGSIREIGISRVQAQWSALNNFFNYLKRRGIKSNNPMELIERPSGRSLPKHIPITAEELRLLLKAIKAGKRNLRKGVPITEEWIARDYAIALLLITTGMRREALVEIDVGEFDDEEGVLTVTDKRHKTFRYELNPKVIAAIHDWMRYRKDILLKRHRDENSATVQRIINNGPLFIGMEGDRISAYKVRENLIDYFKSVSDKPISPHRLRAAFCTLYYEETKDIFAVQKAVGHSSPYITQRYIDNIENQQKKATNYMSKLVM